MQDGQTKLHTAAAFPDQIEILLENTSMFKNLPPNRAESCCHRRIRQQHRAPNEFYRTHLDGLLRLHCSFAERLNILNITQRERESNCSACHLLKIRILILCSAPSANILFLFSLCCACASPVDIQYTHKQTIKTDTFPVIQTYYFSAKGRFA